MYSLEWFCYHGGADQVSLLIFAIGFGPGLSAMNALLFWSKELSLRIPFDWVLQDSDTMEQSVRVLLESRPNRFSYTTNTPRKMAGGARSTLPHRTYE